LAFEEVELAQPERLQEIEQAAIEGIKELSGEIQEKIHLKSARRRENSSSFKAVTRATERTRAGMTRAIGSAGISKLQIHRQWCQKPDRQGGLLTHPGLPDGRASDRTLIKLE